jgi:hypothetical protein
MGIVCLSADFLGGLGWRGRFICLRALRGRLGALLRGSFAAFLGSGPRCIGFVGSLGHVRRVIFGRFVTRHQ